MSDTTAGTEGLLVGNGKAVHARYAGEDITQCGAESRNRHPRLRRVASEVTCRSCLKITAAR